MQVPYSLFRAAVLGVVAFCLTVLPTFAIAQDQPSAEDLKRANNPLADVTAVNLQNYYIPNLYGLPDATANTFWIRGAGALGKWFTRASLPIKTVPTGTDPTSGVGDLNIFAAYLLPSDPDLTVGVGPLLDIPTASEDALGTGKWQLGLAGLFFLAKSPVVQGGALLTVAGSIGGDEDRRDTSNLVIQPFWFWQLGGGTYLRTAPIWFFDLKTGDYNVPFGFGVGKVIKTERIVYNIFLEPQFTMLHDGVGQPAFQVFAGFNTQILPGK
jgi:hypothetical protein